MMQTTAVETRALHKSFGKIEALKSVDLKIESGQIFGLLGANGAGKTTLIRLLIGSSKPSSGSLSVLGFDPTKQARALRKLIGYMPQSPALYEDLSPIENIRFFAQARHTENISEKVDQAIELVGLSKRAHDPVYKYSGGMKQRVSLACALVNQPRILLLDEPTSGIDPKLRETFWEHFRELTSRGVTILMSTHQMNEAMHCDRLAILHHGTLLAADTPRQLLWNNRARIRIWQGERVHEHEVINYPQQLSRELQAYGLDAAISRIEIEEETLETVVLDMIKDHEALDKKEAKDDRNP